MRLALVVEYDGTDYHGFQYQKEAPSIQEEIEKAIERFTGETVRVSGAGRTDAGVHALGQVISFDTASKHSVDTFVKALNFHLPEDIAVKSGRVVEDRFDPRRHAISRRYRYTIIMSATRSPVMRRTAHVMHGPLDMGAMREATKRLVGRHDFARFAGPVTDGRGGTEREIFEASLKEAGCVLKFEFEANAFLPHQVRRMVGAVVDVGRERISLRQFEQMTRGDEVAVAHAAPPQGLCLVRVHYDESANGVGE